MKRKLAFLLLLALVVTLFSACNSGDGATSNPTATTQATAAPTAAATAAPTAAPTEEPADEVPADNLAAGKYEVDSDGFPISHYEYELPLTTSDDVFTFWTTTYNPEYVPEEGYGSMAFPEGLKDRTGVNIEYVMVSSTNDVAKQNYAVLLAADDLCDIMTRAVSFHATTTFDIPVNEGYWVNIYDYKEYAPNYIYLATNDNPSDVYTRDRIFYRNDMIVAFYTMYKQYLISTNYMMRGDWLDQFGMTNDDIITYDDLHEVLTLMKTDIDTVEFPWPLRSSIDVAGSYTFTAFDTLPSVSQYTVGPVFQVDGKVRFAHVNQGDLELMTLLSQWFSEGLIDPNWSTYDNNTLFKDKTTTGQVGYVSMSPGEITDYENLSDDPDCTWVPVHKPLRELGQTIHVGGEISRFVVGSSTVTTNCDNIPLLISWCDWRYSEAGSFYSSWGVEGVLWEYDENGKPMATEWALSGESGLSYSWACTLYALNGLVEHGLQDNDRKYAYEGGERMSAAHEYWADYDYDGAYYYPAGATLNQEESEALNQFSSDIITYTMENYLAFVDGSKPLSDWDSYVEGLENLGLTRAMELYQQAYDRYISERS